MVDITFEKELAQKLSERELNVLYDEDRGILAVKNEETGDYVEVDFDVGYVYIFPNGMEEWSIAIDDINMPLEDFILAHIL